MVRRTFGLGALLIKNGGFEFRPATQTEFECDAGDEIVVGLTFQYEEGNGARNSGSVQFILDLDGVERTARTRLRDLPFVKDEKRGFLQHVVDVASPGERKGTWRVLATLEDRAWTGGGQVATADFAREGTLTLKVKP